LRMVVPGFCQGLVLAYYTALQYMPALAPAQIDRLLRTRRDLSRADHHEILGQCITLYKNSTGDDNFAPGPVDVTGGAPAVPVAQKVSGLFTRVPDVVVRLKS
jgi:hypothetical protein